MKTMVYSIALAISFLGFLGCSNGLDQNPNATAYFTDIEYSSPCAVFYAYSKVPILEDTSIPDSLGQVALSYLVFKGKSQRCVEIKVKWEIEIGELEALYVYRLEKNE